MNEGAAKQNKGDFQGALANFNKALQMSPQDPEIFAMRARLLAFGFASFNAAIEDATKVIQLAPQSPGCYFIRGASYLNTQRLAEAEQDLEKYLQLGGELNGDAARVISIVYSVQQKYDKAIDILTKGIKKNPKDARLYYERGNSSSNSGRCKDAISDYNASIRLDSSYPNVFINRANCRAAMKDYVGAVQDFTELIRRDPLKTIYWYNRANSFEAMGAFASAIQDLTQVLVLDSLNYKARLFLAKVYLEKGDAVSAGREATNLLRMNPQDAAGFTNAGNSVNAYLQREQFFNGGAFAIRANARNVIGNQEGACADIEKALYLGTPAVASTAFCKDKPFVPAANFPQSYQLFPRDSTNTASLVLKGTVRLPKYDSSFVILRKNGIPLKRLSAPLRYVVSQPNNNPSATLASVQAAVEYNLQIQAELATYSFALGVKNTERDTVLIVRDSIVCGDVFLASGQSNIVLGNVSRPRNPYLRTFVLGSADSFWGVAASLTQQDYDIGATGYECIAQICEQQRVPIALINGGLAGSTVEQHFRNNQNPLNTQSWYGRMLWRVREAGLDKAAKAMLWYQGESNGSAGYDEKFATLRTAWQQDYPRLQKTYVVQIRPSECGQNQTDSPREQQRQLQLRYTDIEVVASSALPAHDGCHYGNDGYIVLGNNLARLIARDFYKSSDTLGISSPNLLKAAWTSPKRDEIALTFATNDSLVCGADTSVARKVRTLAGDAFLLDGKPARAVSVRSVEKNTVMLKFAAPIAAQTISYVPEKCYAGSPDAPCVVYEGPWLTTRRGVGALTFTNMPIQTTP